MNGCAPCLSLLSDFGLDDPYVAEMKARFLTEWARFGDGPPPPLVDISHAVPPGDVAAGSMFLQRSRGHFPRGTVHLAVVDPGVGTDRPGLAVRAHGDLFVGPGNGLFAFLAAAPDLEVCRLDAAERPGAGPEPAPTFHGRDVFAVVAAHLARGVPPAHLGRPVGRAALEPAPATPGGDRAGRIVWIDRFGNAITDIGRGDPLGRRLAGGGAVSAAGHRAAGPVRTYADGPADALFWYWGSGGALELARRGRSAAAAHGLAVGQPVTAVPSADSPEES